MPDARYELNTKPGLIMDTTLIKKVVASVPKQHPTLIVFVGPEDQPAFEKQIEGNPKVTGYHADYRAPGIVPKEWKRK